MRLVQHIVSISIHTPLAGSDGTARPWSRPCGNFNPHSPCGERQYAYRHPSVKVEISIHTPLAGSDEAGAAVLVKADVISIHTPLAGSDSLLCGRYQYNKFQSTLPLRGATQIITIYTSQEKISIHTPLAGSDRPLSHSSFRTRYFNPHSPCGERRVPLTYASCICQFQSTLPLRGATRLQKQSGMTIKISIHTPLAGSDRRTLPFGVGGSKFQSTLPLRGATHVEGACEDVHVISIHTPLAGSDRRNETFLTK